MEVKRDDPTVPSSLRSMNLWIQITAIKKQLCEKVSSATAAGTLREYCWKTFSGVRPWNNSAFSEQVSRRGNKISAYLGEGKKGEQCLQNNGIAKLEVWRLYCWFQRLATNALIKFSRANMYESATRHSDQHCWILIHSLTGYWPSFKFPPVLEMLTFAGHGFTL